jgi:tetratricopeptide (TPR) repeat protein
MKPLTGKMWGQVWHLSDSPDMTTIAEIASPGRSLASPPRCTPQITSHERPRNPFGWKPFGLLLLASLSAFNFWWYRRASRPVPDYDTVSQWIRSERYPEAERVLRERLRSSKWDSQARMMLARVLAARNDFLRCARELNEVPFWSSEKPEALLREGQSHLSIDRARDAERAFLEVIRDDPLHPISPALHHDASQELLKIYAIEDRWEDAYFIIWSSYEHAQRVDHPALLSMRLRPELERVSHKESSSVLRRYIAAQPDDWEAFRALARAQAALGQHTDAVRHFQACIKGRPNDVQAWRDYLAMQLDQGDLESFLALLKRPPAGADHESDTWMYRGVASEQVGNWVTAAEEFRKAIELNPCVPQYYYRLAMAEERLGLRGEAIAHRQRTKEMNDARAQLPGAYASFFGSMDTGGKTSREHLDGARKRLALLCETLGWLRAAQAWNRLILAE